MGRAPDRGETSVPSVWAPWASPRCVKWAGMAMAPGHSELGSLPPCAPAWAHEAVLSCPGCCAHGTLPSWQDLAVLQDKLRISTKKLEEYETLFKCQEETTQKLVLEYQARLEEGEERLRRQQEDKDIQMKGIISR